MNRERIASFVVLCGFAGTALVTRAAELPGATVEIPSASGEERVVSVLAGDDLQRRLDEARPGDVLSLERGAEFQGPFRLPRKAGTGWITVQTESAVRSGGRTRASPDDTAWMAALVSSTGSVIEAMPGAHHYHFLGVEIAPTLGTFLYDLVDLSGDPRSIEGIPHHIVFEHCYVHGDAAHGSRRGIALNSASTAILGSYFTHFKERGADAQAIAAWSGPGPYRIENNRLEGSTENLLVGGGDPRIAGLVPSDIVVRANHITKPIAWRSQGWSVKNLLELKNARRVLIEDNLFTNSWSRFAIVFTVRNQDGAAPWSTIDEVTFRRNIVRGVGGGVNILGTDNRHPSGPARNINITDNLFEDVSGARWDGEGRFLQILDGPSHVVVEHNTVFQTGPILMAEGRAARQFVFRDNLAAHNADGVTGTGRETGDDTLRFYFPDSTFQRNVLWGPWRPSFDPRGTYGDHPDNDLVESVASVGFEDWRAGKYALRPSSPYRNRATDGTAIGADVAALKTAFEAASP